MELDEALKASERLREEDDKCYWIAVPGRMARTGCCGAFLYLPESRLEPENKILAPYVGTKCPKCGRIVDIKENAYELIPEEDS